MSFVIKITYMPIKPKHLLKYNIQDNFRSLKHFFGCVDQKNTQGEIAKTHYSQSCV